MHRLSHAAAFRVGRAALLLACACGSAAESGEGGAGQPQRCAARAKAPKLMPGTRAEQMRLEYWLARFSAAELDTPLLSTDQIRVYDRAIGYDGDALYSQRDLLVPPSPSRVQHEVKQRLQYLRERLADGRYVGRGGSGLGAAALAALDLEFPELAPELRVALELVPLRCGPIPEPLFDGKSAQPGAPPPSSYDRNACSAARPQEVVQLLAPWRGGIWIARTRFALGFVDVEHARLSPKIPDKLQAAFVRGPRARAGETQALQGGDRRYELPKHASVPLLDGKRVLVASESGFQELPAQGLVPTRRPLTRRELLTTAFQFVDSPYGFGDADGGRDCSRLQLDLFEAFAIPLPRHSGWQAQAGSYRVDVASASAQDKLAAIAAASRSGVVLLAFPGHIMLHLGKNDTGTPMALHALGEYVQPCSGGQGETVLDVQRTIVSDLSLGAGSSRRSLLERITTLVGFGTPPPELAARARMHPLPPATPPEGEACKDSLEARIFVSPARPIAGQPLRLIATTAEAIAQPALWLYDPRGELAGSPAHRLGGPPSSAWSRIDAPQAGRYTALFSDGSSTLACRRVTVHEGALAQPPGVAEGPVWTPRWSWETDTLNLWSAFVEQLFDDPADDERTWTNLHDLLRDPERNLLHDHLGADEDARIRLEPDCADLPFALRAYFSWKLSLPFGYRQCSRGRPGVPPACALLQTNLMAREDPDDVVAFDRFVNRRVRSGVHSATGRTHPENSDTDLYPVALERASLPAGTVYADPYGHTLMLTKWFPQGSDPADYGILIGAEAQPDGTIGRRRFFRGSFLFDPDTADAGAGFKHFRPLLYDRKAGTLTPLDNATLERDGPFARYSLQQYRGSKDDFYDRMDVLINPAPLDPHVRMLSLLDALEEAVRRRVLAVDNGEQFMAQSPQTIAMPSGHDIFETVGPWEDYATPSRDMRLLIALDSVLALPAQIERAPARFKLADQAAAKAAAERIGGELKRELAARSFSYTRSDGKPQAISLAEVVQRGEALEIAYNPNDCVELRWGAPDGSTELASCKRRAPPEQRTRMERYREWFHTRTRPARGTQ